MLVAVLFFSVKRIVINDTEQRNEALPDMEMVDRISQKVYEKLVTFFIKKYCIVTQYIV